MGISKDNLHGLSKSNALFVDARNTSGSSFVDWTSDDLLHKLDRTRAVVVRAPDLGGCLCGDCCVLAYYGVNHLEPALIFSAVQGGGRRLIDEPKNAKSKV